MDSLGKLLRETRLNANISIGQIAKETKIAKKYLEALENEEYSIFPGDTYIKGFLRSYCEYLNLNPDEMIEKYKRIKIAESPTPIDKLIPKPKMNLRPFFVISLMIALFGGIIFGGIIFYKNRLNKDEAAVVKKRDKKIIKKEEKDDLNSFKISADDKEKTFNLKRGDTVEFSTESAKYDLKIKELSPIVIIEDSIGNTTILIKGYSHKFDINNDNKYDVALNLNFWDSESANIAVKPLEEDVQDLAGNDQITPLAGDNIETIIESDALEKIEFSIDVQEPTYLRYKVDDDKEIEKHYNRRIKSLISAQKRVIIWLSNAGAVTLNFDKQSKTYSPGNMGEIMVKAIQWSKLPSGKYELQISSLN